MIARPILLGLLFLAAIPASPCAAQRKNPYGVPVLLLSGGQREHHGYRDQANALARNLEETGRYRVTIVEDAAILETSAMTNYRAIILHADRRDPEFGLTTGQQGALMDFVRTRRDGGLVAIHGADNAAKNWNPELRTMMGGVFSHDTTGGRPDGKVRKGHYRVKIERPDHPVVASLSDFDLDDELYYHMQMESEIEPLATVEFEGNAWPVAWTVEFGAGRVFHTPLGHRDFGPDKNDPLQDRNVLRLVAQGLEWVVADRSTGSGQDLKPGDESSPVRPNNPG